VRIFNRKSARFYTVKSAKPAVQKIREILSVKKTASRITFSSLSLPVEDWVYSTAKHFVRERDSRLFSGKFPDYYLSYFCKTVDGLIYNLERKGIILTVFACLVDRLFLSMLSRTGGG
jgi:hypothetical protein